MSFFLQTLAGKEFGYGVNIFPGQVFEPGQVLFVIFGASIHTIAVVSIIAAIESFEEALAQVEKMRHASDAKSRAKAELQKERIGHLLELAKLGGRLLDALLSTAKLDAEPLVRFLLGRGPSP